MAPSAIDIAASEPTFTLSPPPVPGALKLQYDDFRTDLQNNGYAVVKGAIPRERADKYRQKALDWLLSFGTDLDLNNSETWVEKNLPVMNPIIRAFIGYGICHEQFMWDVRTEPGVQEAFTKIWGTSELLSSFDGLNITLPNRPDLAARAGWEHVDQSPLKRGLHCVQGIVNLAPCGPEDGGLVVYPGSHKLFDEFFDSQTDSDSWMPKDIFHFSKEQLKWWKDRGIAPQKVCAEPGDLILWDSRLMHYGSDPTEKGKQIRTAIYVACMPASLASPEQLALKKKVFESYGSTTHWPHEHIVFRNVQTFLPDGTRDPRDRSQPLDVPERTDKLLKLAGVLPY
ncbi:putative Phytanoyl-CoA dioxygenase [Seiridium cardinale]